MNFYAKYSYVYADKKLNKTVLFTLAFLEILKKYTMFLIFQRTIKLDK